MAPITATPSRPPQNSPRAGVEGRLAFDLHVPIGGGGGNKRLQVLSRSVLPTIIAINGGWKRNIVNCDGHPLSYYTQMHYSFPV